MGTPIHYKQMALFLVLFLLPELALCGCFLGGNNTEDLIQRNKTILDIMNNTLVNYTKYTDGNIGTFSDFGLWNHIQKTLDVTFDNYLTEGISMGRLLTINWTSATERSKFNSTNNRTLEAYIENEFIDPVHIKLQQIAVNYSFSLGIFRPRGLKFNFAGFNPQTAHAGGSLNLSCVAGSQFTWRLSTSMTYDSKFDDRRSISFARLATMIERSFDKYYRTHDRLGNDFVRVNVLDTFNASSRVIAIMEAYFMNNSYTIGNITSLTDLSKIPIMYFNDGTTALRTVTLNVVYFDNSQVTYIVNSTFVESQTTIASTTAMTTTVTTAKVTNVTTPSVMASTITVPPIISTLLPNPVGLVHNTVTSILSSDSKVNSYTTTFIRSTNSTPITNQTAITPSMTTSSTTSFSTNLSTPNTSIITPVTNTTTSTLPSTNVSSSYEFTNIKTIPPASQTSTLISPIFTQLSMSNGTISTPSVAQDINGSSAIFNAYGQETNTTTLNGLYTTANGNGSVLGNQSVTGYVNGTWFSNQSYTGFKNGTWFGNESYTVLRNWTSIGNQSFTGYVSGTWFGNQTYIGYGKWIGFGNQSYIGYVNGTWFGNLTYIGLRNGTGFGNQSLTGYVSGTWFGNRSFTGYSQWTGLDNQSYSGYVNGTWLVNQGYVVYGNWTGFGNQSFAGNGNGTGFGNQNSTGSPDGTTMRTTFDPDPYFQASVQTIKKIYNDEVLLWKISPMEPITSKMAFLTITIPIALGMIVGIILCMVCLQMDCCAAGRKA